MAQRTATPGAREPDLGSAQDVIDHVTREEGVAAGRLARQRAPRSSHARWDPAARRRGPVEILAAQATTREPDLVPIRHGRMMVSPFTFYRGAAAIMAADLATTPDSGIRVQACGDAHLLNFGGFASPERTLVFDVNDFDETLPGPWEWDVKRLAASIVVAGRGSTVTTAQARAAAEATARAYRHAMREFAAMNELDVWYARLDEAVVRERFRAANPARTPDNVDRTLAKARSKTSMKAFSKLTTEVDGEPRIVADPPLVVPFSHYLEAAGTRDLQAEIHGWFRAYRSTLQRDRRYLLEQFRLVDAARKVVGVGSVGTRCFIVLLMGRDGNDPMFLQFKEAQESVLAPFAGRSRIRNQGERVVAGQRLMQASSDIFLGWIRANGLDGAQRDFYVRQLWDWKISADPTTITAPNLIVYGQLCAWTLARAHARSGDRIAIGAYLGSGPTFDTAVADFAEAYADQNERDYQAFLEAIDAGTLQARAGL